MKLLFPLLTIIFQHLCSIDPKYVQVHLSKQGRRHEEVSVSDGSVNSCSRKIHPEEQFLAFHGIMFHFTYKLRNPVYAQFLDFM